MFFNIPRPVNRNDRVAVNNEFLEEVEDFKYLGSYVASTTKDIQVRKALAWKALEALDVFWKSDMSKKVKIKIFATSHGSLTLRTPNSTAQYLSCLLPS